MAVVIASIPERRDLLIRAIDSVHAQTIGPVELRVVVGMPRIMAYHAACDVDAQYVTWLDDDDYFLPDHLETLITGAYQSDADVIWTRCWHEDEDGQRQQFGWDLSTEHLWNFELIDNAYMYRTSLVKKMGGFPSARESAWGSPHFKALLLGAKFHFIDHEPTMVVSIHRGNMTNKAVQMDG